MSAKMNALTFLSRPHRMLLVATVFAASVGLGTSVQAQSAGSWVDVGPGFAGSGATADGLWTHTDSESRVGANGSMGRGFAVGAGPNGLSLSHSIGVNRGGVGLGHNFNLSIGRNGTHVSHGGVTSQGGNSRVIVGGQTRQGFNRGFGGGVSGGSHATGFGNRTRAFSNSFTRPRFRRW